MLSLPTFNVIIVRITTTVLLITEQLAISNNRKSLDLKSKMYPERSLWPSFLKKINALKR
jgi:hypothetical protein